MSITENDYRNFYFGASAELYIQSELYAFGYEAYKAQPDIGFDICASNNALVKFCNEDRRVFNIQVKSRLVNSGSTKFYISLEDFELLKGDETSVLVCVLVYPRIDKSWNTFDYSNYRESSLMIDNVIYEGAVQYSFSQEERPTVNEVEEKYNVGAYHKKYFWLQSHHIKRINDGGYLADTNILGKAYKSLTVVIDGDSLSLHHPEENFDNVLAEEMQSIKYLVAAKAVCRKDLNNAKMFVEDAFGG